MTDKNNKELFDDVTSDKTTSKKILSKKKWKKIVLYSASGLVLLTLLTSGGVYLTHSKLGNYNDIKLSDKQTSIVNKKKMTTKDRLAYEKKASITPSKNKQYKKVSNTSLSDVNKLGLNYKSWQVKGYKMQKNSNPKELTQNLQEYARTDNIFYGNVASTIPSTASGFTDDVTKALNSDGTPNPKYSYITSENASIAYSSIMNRLLNPDFGEWYTLQYSQGKDNLYVIPEATFKDMFSQNWWDNNVGSKSKPIFPIYADWNGDDYGHMKFKENGVNTGRWYGKVTNENIVTNPSEDHSGPELIVHDDIEFYSFDSNNNKITKKGRLYLKLIPNHDSTSNFNRLVIDDSNLSVD